MAALSMFPKNIFYFLQCKIKPLNLNPLMKNKEKEKQKREKTQDETDK